MPRNTQATRILLELRPLERARGATPEQIARALPADYPKNGGTTWRDLAAVENVGFPLVTDRGDGQIRWKIGRVPGTIVSTTELMPSGSRARAPRSRDR